MQAQLPEFNISSETLVHEETRRNSNPDNLPERHILRSRITTCSMHAVLTAQLTRNQLSELVAAVDHSVA